MAVNESDFFTQIKVYHCRPATINHWDKILHQRNQILNEQSRGQGGPDANLLGAVPKYIEDKTRDLICCN